MALTYKKLSELPALTSSQIDTTTQIVVTTGVSKTNGNLNVSDLIVDDLVTSNSYRGLSAKMGKKLQDEKAPKESPTFTGTVSGITKAMVGLSNVDNTSDANKPVSTAQASALAPKSSPLFTGNISLAGGNPTVSIDCGADATSKILLKDDGGDVLEISSEGSLGTSKIYSASRPLSIITAILKIANLQTFADNTAATALETDTIYKTSTGQLMIKY